MPEFLGGAAVCPIYTALVVIEDWGGAGSIQVGEVGEDMMEEKNILGK